MDFIQKILDCHPLSGERGGLFAILESVLEKYDCEIKTDALGNILFTKKFGKGKNIMLCTGADVPGVIAVYAEKSKIFVGTLGKVDVKRLENSKVVFEGVSGIFTVPENASGVDECYVETFDENAFQKVKQGEKGYFDTPVYTLESGVFSGYDVPVKACVITLLNWAKKLFEKDAKQIIEANGIGSVTVAFLGQSSLSSRGAFTASFNVQPDEIILLSAILEQNAKPSPERDTQYAVKVLDKGFVSDESVVKDVCRYFEENDIKYQKITSEEKSISLNALCRAESTPKAVEICLPVFGKESVYLK